jgi:Mor family transcriptional regulator
MTNDKFYKAIKSQDNINKLYPDRYWPVGWREKPSERTIKIATMYGTGSSITDIMSELNVSRVSVMAVIRRCRRYSEK